MVGSGQKADSSVGEISRTPGRPAVFLDRDGVIDDNVFYADTGAWEGPRTVRDFRLKETAIGAMADLAAAGFLLFVVSNQPNQAKRKATRADHDEIHRELVRVLADHHLQLTEAYYCFHHPRGVDPLFRGPCECRKPSPYFVYRARDDYGVDLSRSWFVGDRATDVETGRRAGVGTVRIVSAETRPLPDDPVADSTVGSLGEAVAFILAARDKPLGGSLGSAGTACVSISNKVRIEKADGCWSKK